MKKIKIIITLFIIVFMLDGCDNNKKIRIDQAEKENGIETEVSEKGRITAGAYYVAALDEKKKIHIAWQTDYTFYAETENTDWGHIDRLLKNEEFPLAISEDEKIIVPKGQSAEELMIAWQDAMRELPEDAVLGNSFIFDYENAEEIEAWEELRFATGQYPKCMIGVLQNGMLCGAGIDEELLTQILLWKDIKEVAFLYRGTKIVAIDKEGIAYAQGVDVTAWPHIRMVVSGKNMFFGLTEEGNVVHTDFIFEDDYSTEKMHDIVSIAVGYDCKKNQDVIYGIRKDGRVVDNFGREIKGFENMKEIDVTTIDAILVGLTHNNKMIVGEGADENFYTLEREYNKDY